MPHDFLGGAFLLIAYYGLIIANGQSLGGMTFGGDEPQSSSSVIRS
jgi:hypothetical protein